MSLLLSHNMRWTIAGSLLALASRVASPPKQEVLRFPACFCRREIKPPPVVVHPFRLRPVTLFSRLELPRRFGSLNCWNPSSLCRRIGPPARAFLGFRRRNLPPESLPVF